MAESPRACLETLLGEPIPAAIARGTILPGQTIDFTHPTIAFVYAWQRWVERRASLTQSFGPDFLSKALDVQELERWNATKDAWKRLQHAIDRGRP